MWLSSLWAYVSPFTSPRWATGFRGIHSVEQFHDILERERARADRNGHQFSVVAFNIDNPEADSTNAKQLASVLIKRKRFTDEIGWFDNHRIAALLPETTASGSKSLAEDVCQILTTPTSPPKYTIYTYPSKELNGGDGHSKQLHLKDIFPERGIKSHSVSRSSKQDMSSCPPSQAEQGTPCIAHQSKVSAEPMERLFHHPMPFWKRAMDVVGAAVALIVFSPLMLLVALIIKVVSPGPVFFKQDRIGYRGKPFTMWKFRTMKVGADVSTHQKYVAKLIRSSEQSCKNSAKPMTKLNNESQIILFGRILRRTYVDELPQLINVLRGEMSLIGPRPPIAYEVEEYMRWHYGRINAVPGMTGLWQVSGKNRLTFDEMTRLDIQYWRKKSLWLDIKIIMMTPIVIIFQVMDSLQNE